MAQWPVDNKADLPRVAMRVIRTTDCWRLFQAARTAPRVRCRPGFSGRIRVAPPPPAPRTAFVNLSVIFLLAKRDGSKHN
jgi:hypothetical protein